MENDNKNLHSGHRQRLRQRYIKSGIDGLEEHQALELLLFYAIPRRDTNDLAHRLLYSFGSMKNLFEADIEDIMEVEGMGEGAAALIKLLPEIATKYWFSASTGNFSISSIESAANYFRPLLYGKPVEHLYIACLDSSYRVKSGKLISSGTPTQTPVYIRSIVREAMRSNVEMIMLAHNHPGGLPNPSRQDVEMTIAIQQALEPINVRLLDHFIISEIDFFSFAAQQLISQDKTKEQAYAAQYSNTLMNDLPFFRLKL